MVPIIILGGLIVLSIVLVLLPYNKCSCQTREKANSVFQKKEKHDER